MMETEFVQKLKEIESRPPLETETPGLGVERITVATAASVSSIFVMPCVAFNRSKHGNFGEQNMFGHLWHDKYDVQCTMIYFFYVLLCSFR